MSSKIVRVWAREVLDSRGNPTVEAEITAGNLTVSAIAPSGASTGTHEALELRDGGKRYGGKGVANVVRGVREIIAPALMGMDVTDLRSVDLRMIELDGTPNKSRLGANATVAVSLAVAQAGAAVKGVPLHEHLVPGSHVLPVPMMNILNGGKHAGSNLKIQEFMVSPAGAPTFAEALRVGAEVYHSLKKKLKDEHGAGAINIGDEGGFAPPLDTTDQALQVITKAIEAAGYVPGRDVYLAIDAAASEFFHGGVYTVDGRDLSPGELVDYYADLRSRYPLISLEDPVMEDDFDTMAAMTRRMGADLQLVGDDLFVTNPHRLKRGIEQKAGNALLLKVNQIGTVTEAMDAAEMARGAGYAVMVSHRSGESDDTSIADIAVALGCGQIKTGAPARGERTAKYNRLLRIEERLGARASFAGRSTFRSLA
ncbi:MAG: phosphopyruvate hydratase [Methanomassiliicoccus sp.]|nr:phosphopyruvate hydratase [Methanomassiliicoccus sp.]